MKKTKWFPCSVKPVRPGLYEVKFASVVCGLCRFNGGRWRKWETGPDTGWDATGDIRPGFWASDRWRGIVK